MIQIENVEVYGWEAAIRGMRNPMNSWNQSDTSYGTGEPLSVGERDLTLMQKLSNAGSDHGKFLRFITVSLDLVAPLYWWKEFDTYKVGTAANSCSTMHKIHAKPFRLADFSHEHLDDESLWVLEDTISHLNLRRRRFLDTNARHEWWQLIQLLPTSYNQRRTVTLNYQVLKNMYHARKNHKLDEWRIFCEWIRTLPHSELITGEETA